MQRWGVLSKPATVLCITWFLSAKCPGVAVAEIGQCLCVQWHYFGYVIILFMSLIQCLVQVNISARLTHKKQEIMWKHNISVLFLWQTFVHVRTKQNTSLFVIQQFTGFKCNSEIQLFGQQHHMGPWSILYFNSSNKMHLHLTNHMWSHFEVIVTSNIFATEL